jgi:hypothetical protein
MWSEFNPEQQKTLTMVKLVTALRQQVPTKEWPLIVDGATILVVREWETGEITASLNVAGAAGADGTSPSNQ